mmetsp:Transcript_261/g.1075  ORF Transcript_261/g.1075 Transcript_261/m.1075 type:complete len:235 (+) Transcript_261:2577-3281(+)
MEIFVLMREAPEASRSESRSRPPCGKPSIAVPMLLHVSPSYFAPAFALRRPLFSTSDSRIASTQSQTRSSIDEAEASVLVDLPGLLDLRAISVEEASGCQRCTISSRRARSSAMIAPKVLGNWSRADSAAFSAASLELRACLRPSPSRLPSCSARSRGRKKGVRRRRCSHATPAAMELGRFLPCSSFKSTRNASTRTCSIELVVEPRFTSEKRSDRRISVRSSTGNSTRSLCQR